MKSLTSICYLLLLAAPLLSGCNSSQSPSQSASQSSGKDLPGKDITELFLSNNRGTFLDSSSGEEIVIGANGAFEYLQDRQVGTKGGPIPYPTICSYVRKGVIKSVYERDATHRAQYMDYATHEISYRLDSVTLVDSPHASTTNDNCKKYEDSENRPLAIGELIDSLYAEILSPDQIRLHTAGGASFKPTDELFVRTP